MLLAAYISTSSARVYLNDIGYYPKGISEQVADSLEREITQLLQMNILKTNFVRFIKIVAFIYISKPEKNFFWIVNLHNINRVLIDNQLLCLLYLTPLLTKTD